MKPMGRLIRYLRVYRLLISSSIKLFLSHRFNFLMDVLANMLWTFSQLISLRFLFDKIPNFQGWGFSDLILLLGFGQIYVYGSYMIYDANLSNLPKKLISGEFDRMLTKPINIKFLSSFGSIVIAQIIPTITTVTPLILYGLAGRENLTVYLLAVALLLVIGGLIAFYFLTLSLIGLSFFIDNAQSVKDFLVQRTTDLSRIPISYFPKSVQMILTYAIPLAFVAYFPVLIIKDGEVLWSSFLSVFCLSLVFYLIQKIVWSKGLKNYSGVG